MYKYKGTFFLDMLRQGQAGIDSSSQGHCHVQTSPKFPKFHKLLEQQRTPGQACECGRPGLTLAVPSDAQLLAQSTQRGAKEHLLDNINKGMNAGRKGSQATYWAALWSGMRGGQEKRGAGCVLPASVSPAT